MATDESNKQKKKHDDDVVSDPARTDEQGQEWADEGGATPEGPATSDEGSAASDD